MFEGSSPFFILQSSIGDCTANDFNNNYYERQKSIQALTKPTELIQNAATYRVSSNPQCQSIVFGSLPFGK